MARRLDWTDIALHIAGAVAIVAGAALLFDWSPSAAWLAAMGNMLLWPLRETWQDVRKGHRPPWPARQSDQKWWEAWPPVWTGFVVALGITLWWRL